MPLNPDAYKKLKGAAKLGVISNMMKSAPPAGFNKPSSQKFASVTGTRKVLVILVDFSDNTGMATPSSFNDKLFSVGTYATGSMRDYYKEVSYGTFDISGTVTVKWYRAPQVYNYYVNYLAGIWGSYPNNAQKLAEDAVALADADIDFSQYDSNGDGTVDGLFIVHAGGGAEADGNYGKIWSHKGTTSAYITVDGVKVFDYTMEPEDGEIGVFCHEYGHELGLPDLYDTVDSIPGDGGYDENGNKKPDPPDSYGIGNWSVMGTGAWLNSGKTPAHFDAWSKIQLGWITPTVPATNQFSASVPQSETNASAYKLWTGGSVTGENFVVENRQKVGFDAYLQGSGLVIYHVDDSMPASKDNDDESHYHVSVVQADGLKDLENHVKENKGDEGDPFPGTTANKNFNGSTTPNTKSYAGAETYVAVMNISDSGVTMTADLYVSSADVTAPTCTVAALSQYTNAAAFTVAWSATDTGNPASGVKTYDVQYRAGSGGAWTDWFTGTTATQAASSGSDGQTYYYRCRATDNAGNAGSYSSEAYTTLDLTAPTATITPLAVTQVKASFDVSWSARDSMSGVKSYDVEYMDASDGLWKNNWVQAGTTLTTATFAGIDGHTYYFRVRATDNAGNTGSFTSASNGDVQTIVAVDSIAPVISDVKVTYNPNSATSVTITWTTDEDSDSQVEYGIEYEYGKTQELSLLTSLDSSMTKNHKIEVISLAEKVLYIFKVRSKDLAANLAVSDLKGIIARFSYVATFPKGLSMISFPMVPSSFFNAGTIFSDANLKFARYDASVSPPKYHYYKDNPNDAELQVGPGRGFWVKLDAEKSISIISYYLANYFSASSWEIGSWQTGWNQIGNPFPEPVDISTLQVAYQGETLSFADANKKGWLANYFWGYENEQTGYKLLSAGLTSSQTLDTGKGYWIYATVPCTLIFTIPAPSTAKLAAKESSSSQNQSELVQFTLSSTSGSDSENYVGFSAQAMKISDPPPPIENSDKPALSVKATAGSDSSFAMVAKQKNYGEETFYLSAAGIDGEQGTLTWNYSAENFAYAVLVDVSSNKEISLLSEKQYSFTLTKEPKQFLVKLKLNSVISDAVLLNSLKVLSVVPYPSPSKGKLSFNLEAEGSVTELILEVYTITGKRILSQFLPAAAFSGEKGKGKFKAESPSLDAALGSLPSGVYVYRLQVSNGVETVSKTGKFVVVK